MGVDPCLLRGRRRRAADAEEPDRRFRDGRPPGDSAQRDAQLSSHVIVAERPERWRALLPELAVITAREYLVGQAHSARRLRVINLCAGTRYLSRGYYCSLLADARGQRALPSVRTIAELNREIVPLLDLRGIGQRLRHFEDADRLEIQVLFGRTSDPRLAAVARALFESFPCPALQVELVRDGDWQLRRLRQLDPDRLSEADRGELAAGLLAYLAKPRRMRTRDSRTRYDVAILHDPDERLPPSDPKALERFREAARRMGLGTELITRKDLGRLAEFDALFIRATTGVSHYTFRAAKRAEAEGLAVIDDPQSILRCTNKLYLAELLKRHGIPAPRTLMVDPEGLEAAAGELGYPMVLKIPDGSFSRGVHRADDAEDLAALRREVFSDAELVLCQEFLYTPFDWRIGVLDREALWACRYYMSRRNWKIVNHSGPRIEEGRWDTLPLDEVPAVVLDAALRAARAVGDGFYGVDVKQLDGRVAVIEVNDNPNVEAGVEDRVEGRRLYDTVMASLLARIEARHPAKRP